jgi:hypothetical protein
MAPFFLRSKINRPWLSAISLRRASRNYNGGDLQQQPYQNELRNQSEDQGQRIWQPNFHAYPSLR